jgi:hypothetical protein
MTITSRSDSINRQRYKPDDKVNRSNTPNSVLAEVGEAALETAEGKAAKEAATREVAQAASATPRSPSADTLKHADRTRHLKTINDRVEKKATTAAALALAKVSKLKKGRTASPEWRNRVLELTENTKVPTPEESSKKIKAFLEEGGVKTEGLSAEEIAQKVVEVISKALEDNTPKAKAAEKAAAEADAKAAVVDTPSPLPSEHIGHLEKIKQEEETAEQEAAQQKQEKKTRHLYHQHHQRH